MGMYKDLRIELSTMLLYRLYHISRNIDSDFNLVIWRLHKDYQINLHHYQSIYIYYKQEFLNQVRASHRLAHLVSSNCFNADVGVYVCVCVPTAQAMNN